MGSAVTLLIVIPSIPMMWTLGNDYTFFSSKNYYAYPVLIYFIAELAIFKLSDRIRYKVFRVSVLIIILAILLLSGRRSTLICAVLAMLFHFTNLRTAIVFGVLTFLAVINIDFTEISIFGFDIQQTSTYQRINRVDFNNFHDTSIQARRNVWNLYLERFYDSPVFGSGLHSGEAVLGNVYSGVVEKIGYHNTFLQVLIEVGIVGFFFFILYALKSMLAMRTNLPFFLPLFIPTLLVNYFEANLLPGQLLFIYTITIWIALNRYKKHRKTNFCIKRGYIIHGKEVSIQKNIKSIRR
jgi:O-antigen ligase